MESFYAKENYSLAELEEAKQSISIDKAYEMVTDYYQILNCAEDFRKGRIDSYQLEDYMEDIFYRAPDELTERPGYGKNLGTELLPSSDIEYEKELRKAFILVDNDFRQGGGRCDFIERFASVLPYPFVAMSFIFAIYGKNIDMIDAIKNNDIDLFIRLDNQLEEVFPDLRKKIIRTGTFYSGIVLDNFFSEINLTHRDDRFEQVADFYQELTTKQRAEENLFAKVLDCFDLSQNHCRTIDMYLQNKKLFLNKVLGVMPGKPVNPNKIIGSVPADLLLISSTKACPFDYACDRLLDLVLASMKGDVIDTKGEHARELLEFASLIINIDIDERKECEKIESVYGKKQEIKRPRVAPMVMEYANTILRESIDSLEKAIEYIQIHYNDNGGYLAPDSLTMQKILKEYGNNPQIKNFLFKNSPRINRLWKDISFDMIPEEYTTYEKMKAGSLIISNNVKNVDTIPEDIKNRIFDSEDCITNILFPGLGFNKSLQSNIEFVEIGSNDDNKNANALLIAVLRRISPRLKNSSFLREVLDLYLEYFRHKYDASRFVDFKMAAETCFCNSASYFPATTLDFFGIKPVHEDSHIELDNSSEFVQTPKHNYSQTELEEAKETLTLREAIRILEQYYKINWTDILKQKKASISFVQKEEPFPREEQKLLGLELPLIARGDLLKKAAIVFDNALFGSEELDEIDLDMCHKFVMNSSAYFPVDFNMRYKKLMEQKHILDRQQMKFYPTIYKNDALIRTCRKYVLNEAYRKTMKEASIDIRTLANIINNYSFENENRLSMHESGLDYLLITMMMVYAKYDYEGTVKAYRAGKDFVGDEIIRQANEKASSVLVDSRLSNEDYEFIQTRFYRNDGKGYYSLSQKLADAMMNQAFNSNIFARDESAALKLEEGMKNFTFGMDLSEELAKNPTNYQQLLRNISPDAFLGWDFIGKSTLKRLLFIMIQNDITVLDKLYEVTKNDTNQLLRNANTILDDEDLENFRAQLSQAMEEIIHPQDPKDLFRLIENKEASDYNNYPPHKQKTIDYIKSLMKYLTKEQREDMEELGDAFKAALQNDKRCTEKDIGAYMRELRDWNKLLNEEQKKRTRAVNNGNFPEQPE